MIPLKQWNFRARPTMPDTVAHLIAAQPTATTAAAHHHTRVEFLTALAAQAKTLLPKQRVLTTWPGMLTMKSPASENSTIDLYLEFCYNTILTHKKEPTVSAIRIVSGEYRNKKVNGNVFKLVSGFQTGARGGYVTVQNDGAFANCPDTVRIRVNSISDYEMVSGEAVTQPDHPPVVHTAPETEQQAMARIRERFEILSDMTKAATAGDIRAMIVSGPPGVGKSFGVELEIDKATMFDKLAGRRLRAEVVKGSATPLGLYQTLYKFSDENCVLVFDDCDSILLDDVALNLLKGALDSGKKRKISWLAESSALRREGIPDSFEFKGSVIFITNLKFDKMKSQKLRDHLDALQSRCHYLDLTLDTMQDKILRIRQIASDGVLFADYDFEQCQQNDIIEFMNANQNRLREMSLRMALKVADLVKSFPAKWRLMAETTCMKPGQ